MPFRDAWLVIGVLMVFVGFGAEEPAIGLIGVVVVILGAVARYWSKHLFDRVTLKRTLSERRAFIGEEIGVDIELSNKKPLPLPWYEWRVALGEALPAENESVGSAAAPGLKWLHRRGSLGWYQQHRWKFALRPTERGYHQFGPGTIRSADLLGAFPRLHDDGIKENVVIFPRVFPMADMGLPSERPFGERKGGNRVFEDPLRIAGMREFRPGDPMRRIDWKATARSGELRSRVYEPSATQQLYLLVNIDTMEHSWEGYLKDQLERIVTVTASVAAWAAGARYAVGLLANGAFPDADRPIRLPPSRSRDQISRILEALAVIQPLTMGDLAGTIQKESGKLPAGSTLVVVASIIPDSLAGVMDRLRGEGHHLFVVATSPRVRGSVPPGIPMHEVAGAFEREGVFG